MQQRVKQCKTHKGTRTYLIFHLWWLQEVWKGAHRLNCLTVCSQTIRSLFQELWWNVTKCIYSNAVIKCNFKVVTGCFSVWEKSHILQLVNINYKLIYAIFLSFFEKVCIPAITHVWISSPCSHPKITATWTITHPQSVRSMEPTDRLRFHIFFTKELAESLEC